jgi:hypothetical protein
VVATLEAAAGSSGGRLWRIDGPDQLEDVFSAIGTAIRTAYACQYEPDRPFDQFHHRLRVTVDGRPDLVVQAPQGYGGG